MKKINSLLLICLFAFSAQFSAQITTYPFVEGFEGVTFPPTGWTVNALSGTSSWTKASNNRNNAITARTGSSLALFYSNNYNGNESVLSTPSMDLTGLTTPELVVYNTQIDWGGDQDTLGVFYKTSAAGNWTYLTSFTGTVSAWNEIKLVLPNPSNDYYVGFRAFADWGYGVTLDDFQVRELPACQGATANQATNITATAATLNWIENGTATTWRVEWDTSGYAAGTARNSIVVNTNPLASIIGLSPQTAYDWKVQALCSPTDSSALVPGSFFTACNAVSTFPYSENFDGSLTNNVWDCWTVINADNDARTWTQSSTYITPRSGAWTAHGMGNQNDHLISPQLILPAGINMRMKVWDIVESASQPNDYSILVSTTGTAIADFTDTLASYTVTNTTWTERKVDLSAYTGQTIYISMWQSYSNSNFWGFGLDDFTVEQSPACLAATANQATNMTATAATLNWIENGTATTWRVEWDTLGYAAGTARNTMMVTTDTFLTISGLTSATAYDWNVRALCNATDSSILAGGNFTTLINGPQGFNCITGNSSTVFSDDLESTNGWTGNIGTGSTVNAWNYDAAGTGSSGTGPNAAHSGNQYVYVETSGATVNPVSFISPSIDLTSGNNFAELSFWVHAYGGNIGTLDVGVSTSATGPFTNLWTFTGAIQAAQSDPFQNVGINLDTYVGQTIFVEFLYTTNGSFAGDIALDLIEVSTCQSCAAPSSLAASNVTATSADLGWIESGTATQWEVEWDTSGYTVGTSLNSIIVNTTASATISGLTATTDYDYNVRAICAAGDSSGWMSSSFQTPCATNIAPFFDGFENHTVISGMDGVYNCWTATRQNTSNDWNVDNFGSTPSSGTGPAGPYAGTQYIFLEASAGTAGAEAEFISPVIDINGLTTPIVEFYYHMFGNNLGGVGNLYVDVIDGAVTTTIDSIINEQQANQNDPWLKRSIVLPATSGTIQISLRATRGALSQYGDISVDDFSVIDAPSCLEPNALVSSSIGAYSATIGWTENNTAAQWEIEYGFLGSTPGTGTTAIVTSNPFNLTGLNSSTDYGWRVRSICGAADTSLWSSNSSFKTAFQCPAGATCATYTAGYITSDRGFTSLPGTSTCADSMVLAIPSGDRIDSMSTLYDMTAFSSGGAWMSEQRSWLYSPTLIAGEATITNGPAANTAGTASYSRTGLNFANGATGNVVIQMHAGRTYGGTACAGGINDIDSASWIVIAYHSPVQLAPISLPITWDNGSTVDLTTIDFGGNTSTLVADPTNASNTVLQSIKGAGAQVWAGTTFGNSLATPIAFASGTTTIRAVVYSPIAGIEVRLKVEDKTNPAISVETVVNTTVANGWDTLSFNFINNAAGTGAINFANTYDKMSIFYNFGVSPAAADTFYVDYVEDVSVNAVPPVPAKAAIALPITWDDTANVNYSVIDFGGNNSTSIADPTNATNIVLQSIKGANAQTWGGTTFGDSLASAIPFSAGNTTIRAVVYSPTAGTPVRLKVEDYDNPAVSVETEVLTTVANAWDTLNFDMSSQAAGTAAINFANTYDKMSIFYNFGTSPTSAETYYVDYIELGNPPVGPFACPSGAICATYGTGDISTDDATTYPAASACPGTVSVIIPAGNRIDSVRTFYDMTAQNGAWLSEQESFLSSPTTSTSESGASFGTGNTAGTFNYDRSGLTFANGAIDTVIFEMNAQRSWSSAGAAGCSTFNNKVDSATWTVIAYYSPIPTCLEPTALSGTALSTTSASVTWTPGNVPAAGSYEIRYGLPGFTAGMGTQVNSTSTSATITGLTPSTTYEFYVRANCGVGNTSPWSLAGSFATLNGVPYFQNFELFTNGSPASEGWFNTATGNPQWLVDAGGTPSSATGPNVDHTSGTVTGKYVFLETSGGVAGVADTMVSAPIAVDASQSILELSFWYHFHGASVGSMEAWIIDSSGTLNLIGTIAGQQQPVQTDPWLRAKFIASGYQGQSVRLAFVGIRGASFTGDIAIDDVRLDLPPADEIGITDILRPSSGCGLGADSVEVQITNFGSASQTGFNIGYSLNGVAITPETVTATLGAGMSMNYTFSTTAALATANNYEIVTYTLLTGDADATNDTLGTNVNSFAIVSAFPYATSFETGNDSWFATGDASWELGTPAGFVIDTASNGTQAWVTDLDANYGDGLNAFLTSPCFDFTSIANPAINLDIWYDIESRWDGAFMQSTTDGGATWTTIGSEDDIINWYNDTSRVPVDNNYSTVGDSWTGDGSVSGVNGTNGWITASHELDGLGGQASVQLRIVLATDGNTNADGLGVDNIEIYDRDPSYAIGILNTEDATGVADSLGTVAWTSGVVVGIDLDGNNGISFTIIDDENGIQEGMNIFNFNDVSNYVVTEGDEILVHGDIIQFNGLTELSPDSILVLSSGNAIPTPIVVTDLDETTESRWLSIPTNWVSLSTSGAFSSNINLTNGIDTITMRIDSDTDINDSLTSSGLPIVPGDTICGLLGVGGQFDNSSPYTSGYQIFPMRWSDLSICRLSTGIEDARVSDATFELVPNPTNGTFEIRSSGFNNSTVNISIRDLSGRIVASEFVNNATSNFRKSFDLNEQAKGIYFITILDGENVINKKVILQ